MQHCGTISDIVNVLNDYEMLQPKLENVEMLPHEQDQSEKECDILEE